MSKSSNLALASKNSNMINRWFSLSLVLVLIAACTKRNEEDLRASLDPNEANNKCDTTDVRYSNSIEMIISTNCAQSGCHVGPNGIGDLDLSTYEDVKRIAENGDLVGRITGTTGPIMPTSGALPDCDIEKIERWVAAGAENN